MSYRNYESQNSDNEVIVTNVTNVLWKFVERTLGQSRDMIMDSSEFRFFCKAIYGGSIMVHDCVTEGPNFNRDRLKMEPHFVYYFDDVTSLFDWLCLHVQTEELCTKLQKFYDILHQYQLIEKMNESIRKVSLFSLDED